MKVENLPEDFLDRIEDSVCAFSDNSQFIYMVSCKKKFFEIFVHDITFNKSIFLKPDSSVTDAFNQIKGFKNEVTNYLPDVEIVKENQLFILFNDHFFIYSGDDGDLSDLLILVELNFSSKTFSLMDKRIYQDCYYAGLYKNDSRFGLLHSFAVDPDIYSNDEFLGYFHLEIIENQICQINEDRIVFDYENKHGPFYNLHKNQLWLIQFAQPLRWFNPYVPSPPPPPGPAYNQLSYFELNEPKPKQIKTQLIEDNLHRPQWIENNLLYYDKIESEFLILNYLTGEWSRIKNNPTLVPFFEKNTEDLIWMDTSPRLNGSKRSYQCVVDRHFNVTFIDKSKKHLQKIPLKEPLKLGDIAWITALNHGFFDQKIQKLPKKLLYSRLF